MHEAETAARQSREKRSLTVILYYYNGNELLNLVLKGWTCPLNYLSVLVDAELKVLNLQLQRINVTHFITLGVHFSFILFITGSLFYL